MLKQLVTMALRGLVRELAINPRNIRLVALLDDEEHLLAKLDATTLQDLLRRAARKRVLRIWLGKVAYDIDLGPAVGAGRRRMGQAPRQRGYDHE